MNPKHPVQTPGEVIARLRAEGWTQRKGKGDHVHFSKPGMRFIVTVDTGRREVPTGTLRSIYKAAGWSW